MNSGGVGEAKVPPFDGVECREEGAGELEEVERNH